MSQTETVEFAGIELSEGDEITVDYDTDFGVKTKTGVIESFMYERSSRMPTCVKFGGHDSVGEDKVVEIEQVA